MKIALAIIFSLTLGLVWSALPMFGWSEYSFEGVKISCSVEWNKKTTSVISYNICTFFIVFVMPLFMFIYTKAFYVVSFLNKFQIETQITVSYLR